MEIEATQAMDANCESEEEDERPRDKRIMAVLKVHKQKGYEEQEFPIYEGRNIVGRHEKSDIYIPAAPVSKKHACIEVVSGVHLIFDYGSKNKTKRGQLVLRPQVRYELTDGVKLAFADCECRYSCTHEQPQADDTDSMQESVEERACVTDEINTSSQSTQKLSNQDRHSTDQIMKGRHAKIVNKDAQKIAGTDDEEIYAADSDGDSPMKRPFIAETPRGPNKITVVKQTPGTVLRRIHGAPLNDTGNSTKILNQSTELNASSDMSLRLDMTPASVPNSPAITSRSVDGSATASQQKCALTSDSVDSSKGLNDVDMGLKAVEPDLSDPKDFESDLTGHSALGSDSTCQKAMRTSDEYSFPKQKSEKENGNIDASINRHGKLSDLSILEAKLVVQESDGDATDNSEEAEYQLEIGKTGFFTPNLLENVMNTKNGVESKTGVDKTERNDSENFSQDCMLIATQAYGVEDSEEPQRASDITVPNDVRMEEESVSPSELCIQESDEEEGEEDGIMTRSFPKAVVSGKVSSSQIKDTEMNDTKDNLVSDEDYDTYDSEQEADTGPPAKSGQVAMAQPISNSDQEASTVPLLPNDQEANTVPLPLSDQEASTVPLSFYKQEANNVPLPCSDQEADTVPLSCSDQDANAIPLSPSDQEAKTVPLPSSDQEACTVPLPLFDQEAATVSFSCSDQEANTVPLPSSDHEACTVPLPLFDQEANTVPLPSSDQEANTVPLPCSDQEADTVPQYDSDEDAIVSPSSSKKSSETLRNLLNEQESTASLSNSEKETTTAAELTQQKDDSGTQKRVAKKGPKDTLKDDNDDDDVLERRDIVGGRETKSLGTDQPLFGAEDSGNPAYDDLSDNFDVLSTKKPSFKTSVRKTSIKCMTLPGGAASLKSLPVKTSRKLEQSSKGNSETGISKKQDFLDDLETQDYGMDESISNNEQNVPINEAFVPETQPYDDIDVQTQVYALEDQPTILYENSSNIKTPRSKRPVEQSSIDDDDNATQAYGLLCEGAPSIEESQSDADEADQCATQAYGLLDQQTIPYSLEADTDETDELATQAYGVLTKASLDKDDDDDTGDFCATQAYGLSDENKPGLDAKREETETGNIDDIETQAYGILGNIELDEKFLTKSDSEETDELATQAYGVLTKASLDKDDDDDTAADDFETQAYGVSDAANVADEKYLEKSDNEETDEDLDQATQAYGLSSNDLPKRGTNDDMLPPRRGLSGRAAKTRRTVTWSQGRPMENEGDPAENDSEEKQENSGEDEALELKIKAKKAGRPKLGAAVSNSGKDEGSLKKGRPRRATKSMTAEADENTNIGRRSLARKVQLSDDEGVKAKAEETMTAKKNQRAKRTISEQISQEDEAISTGGGQPNTHNFKRNQNDNFVDKKEPVDHEETEEYSKLKRSRRVSKATRQRGNSQRGRRKTVDHEISDDEESGKLSERKKIGVVTDSSAKKENWVEEEEEADTFDEETDSLGANEQSIGKKDKKSHLEAQQSKSRRGRKRGSSRTCIMEREPEVKNAGLEMTFAKDDATAVDNDVSVRAPEIDENKCLEVLKSRGKKRGISSQSVKEKRKENDRIENDGPGTTNDEGNSTVKVVDVSAMASGIEESKFHEEPVSVSRRGRKRRTLSENVKERENENDGIKDNRLEDINAKNDSVVNDIDVSVRASDKVENERHKAQGSTSRRGRNRRPLSMNVHEHGDNGTANDESNKTDIYLDSSTADNDISLGATEREGNRRRGARKSVSGRGRKRGTSKKSVIEQESIMMEDNGIETTINEQNIAADDIDAPLVTAEGAARRHDVITKKPRENGDDSLLEHSATSVDTSLSGDQPGKNRRRTNVKGKGHATKCNVNEEEDKDQDAKEEVPRIMFTGLTDKNIEKSALVLGAQLADSVYEATHLVTDKVRRTVKFLCCLSRGIPIVGPQWLAVCKQNNSFGDAGEYTVKDKSTEKQYDFSLQRSLQLAKERKLLDEYSVYVTKNVKPDPKQMKDIIQCCGGQALHRLPKHVDDKTLIISCEEDKSEVKNAAKSGYQIYTAEFLLTGILRQKLEPDLFKLDVESESEKRGNKRNHSRSELETSKNTPKRRKR